MPFGPMAGGGDSCVALGVPSTLIAVMADNLLRIHLWGVVQRGTGEAGSRVPGGQEGGQGGDEREWACAGQREVTQAKVSTRPSASSGPQRNIFTKQQWKEETCPPPGTAGCPHLSPRTHPGLLLPPAWPLPPPSVPPPAPTLPAGTVSTPPHIPFLGCPWPDLRQFAYFCPGL